MPLVPVVPLLLLVGSCPDLLLSQAGVWEPFKLPLVGLVMVVLLLGPVVAPVVLRWSVPLSLLLLRFPLLVGMFGFCR